MFHRQDQNQKKVRRHPITFLSPFSIYLYDCINLFLSTKYVFMTMRKWMHALVTTLWGAQVWNYSYYYFLKENFARAWRTLGKLFQVSKLDGLIMMWYFVSLDNVSLGKFQTYGVYSYVGGLLYIPAIQNKNFHLLKCELYFLMIFYFCVWCILYHMIRQSLYKTNLKKL